MDNTFFFNVNLSADLTLSEEQLQINNTSELFDVYNIFENGKGKNIKSVFLDKTSIHIDEIPDISTLEEIVVTNIFRQQYVHKFNDSNDVNNFIRKRFNLALDLISDRKIFNILIESIDKNKFKQTCDFFFEKNWID